MWRKCKPRITPKKTIYSCLVITIFCCVVVVFRLYDNAENSDAVLRHVTVSTTIREPEYPPESEYPPENEYPHENEYPPENEYPLENEYRSENEYTPENEYPFENVYPLENEYPPENEHPLENDPVESTAPVHYYPVPPGQPPTANVNIHVPGTRPWKRSRYTAQQEMTYVTSPYNWVNKKGSVALTPNRSSGKPLLIAWQASETLMIEEKSSAVFENCPVSRCKISPASKVIQRASAVVFDDEEMAVQTPPDLKEDRMLVYYSMRSPNDVITRKTKEEVFDEDWKSAFNWVWSYRQDSDIFEPFGYIKRVRLFPPASKPPRFMSLIKAKSHLGLWINPHLKGRKNDSSETDRNLHKGKSHTGIERYLKAFNNVAPLNMTSIDNLRAAMRAVNSTFRMTKYFFVLAFEWVDCDDYVSDLFFDVFDPRIFAVPVVRGRFNYSRHFPAGTFVNANDFQNPAELAAYLTELASNKKAYTEMLWKKIQHVREKALPYAWCQLCDLLHRAQNNERLRKRIDDIYAWFQEGGACEIVNKTEINMRKLQSHKTEKAIRPLAGENTDVKEAVRKEEGQIAVNEAGGHPQTESTEYQNAIKEGEDKVTINEGDGQLESRGYQEATGISKEKVSVHEDGLDQLKHTEEHKALEMEEDDERDVDQESNDRTEEDIDVKEEQLQEEEEDAVVAKDETETEIDTRTEEENGEYETEETSQEEE